MNEATALLARSDAVATRTLHSLLRSHRLPSGIEQADALVIARVAAWQAAQRYDPARGATWETWVIGLTKHALQEIWRQRQYGGQNRYSGRCLKTVPLHVAPAGSTAPLADVLVDARDGYAAADDRMEARKLVAVLKSRMKPRLFATLAGTLLADQTYREHAAAWGISETRVTQLMADARKDAREVLSR